MKYEIKADLYGSSGHVRYPDKKKGDMHSKGNNNNNSNNNNNNNNDNSYNNNNDDNNNNNNCKNTTDKTKWRRYKMQNQVR